MLDRVTDRKKMRDELITITRMLLDLPPAIKGDLPPPEPVEETPTEETPTEETPAADAAKE